MAIQVDPRLLGSGQPGPFSGQETGQETDLSVSQNTDETSPLLGGPPTGPLKKTLKYPGISNGAMDVLRALFMLLLLALFMAIVYVIAMHLTGHDVPKITEYVVYAAGVAAGVAVALFSAYFLGKKLLDRDENTQHRIQRLRQDNLQAA